MPTTYAGDGTVPNATKPWVRVAITAVANTTPIQVTSPGHGFNTGDTVEIQGTGIVAVDSPHQITVGDADHYTLNGSVASGTSATGYAIDMQVQPAIVLPADGEDVESTTSNPPLEESANVVPFLYRRLGQWSLWDEGQYVLPASLPGGGLPYTTAWSSTSVANATPPTTLASTVVSLGTILGGGPEPVITGSDMLECQLSFSALIGSNALPDAGFMGLAVLFRGAGPTDVASLSGSVVLGASDQPIYVPVTLRSYLLGGIGFPFPSVVSFALQYYVGKNSGGTMTLNLNGPFSFLVKHWRRNV